MAEEILLETHALSRRFGALAAVDAVSLSFLRGQVHAVIGPNGAGKSTLLNLLSGELRPSSGRVSFRGQDVTRAPPDLRSRLGLGRSYQTANLFAELSAWECVRLAAQSRMRGALLYFRPAEQYPQVEADAERALRLCGLAERALIPAGQLSYGEQRQLELGMIVATGPELLLLDEPLAGLGHDEAERVLALLHQLATAHTLVLIEHDMDAVFAIAAAITVLVDGRVLETGSPGQIRSSAAVRKAYLGEESP